MHSFYHYPGMADFQNLKNQIEGKPTSDLAKKSSFFKDFWPKPTTHNIHVNLKKNLKHMKKHLRYLNISKKELDKIR